MQKISEIKNKLVGFSKALSLGNNQVELIFKNGKTFQFHESTIVIILEGKVYLGSHWDYSTTTSKYRNNFLNSTTAETKAKIESGEYTLLEGY